METSFKMSCILRWSLFIFALLLLSVTSAQQDADDSGMGMINSGTNNNSSKFNVGILTFEYTIENGSLSLFEHQIKYSGSGTISLPSDCDVSGLPLNFGVPVFRVRLLLGLIVLGIGFLLGSFVTSLVYCCWSCCFKKNGSSGSSKSYSPDPEIWKMGCKGEKGQFY